MNKYGLAAVVAINELDDNESHKLSAKQQREMFGYVACGRKGICFDSTDQGTVRISTNTDGTDASVRSYSYEEFAQCINDRQQVEAW